MFIVDIEYIASIEDIDRYLLEHRAFLETCYQKGLLLASGPKNPRMGGILIALGEDRLAVEAMTKQDPFFQHHLARYTITEFSVVKCRQEIKHLI